MQFGQKSLQNLTEARTLTIDHDDHAKIIKRLTVNLLKGKLLITLTFAFSA